MSLLGREPELLLLHQWADSDGAILEITGEAGVGKSALLLAWAQTRDDTLTLACQSLRTPEELASALADALDARQGWLEDAMRAREPTILILDDADVATSALELLPHWRTTAPHWRFVICARRAQGTASLLVPPLSLENAESLLRVHTDPGAWARASGAARAALLNLLDGNPLAILLAAGRTRLLELDAIYERLRHQRRTLGGGLGRFASLSEAFSLSWDALDPESQRLLGDALVFQGDFDLEAAETVLAPPTHDILDVMNTWSEHHVIRTVAQSPLRVSICRALRADIAARCAPPDDALLTRHAQHFACRAELYPNASAELGRHLPHELPDILRAREQLPQDPRLLTFLGWLLSHRHVTTNWRAPATPVGLTPREEAVALQRLAIGWVQRGEPARARRPLETALDLLEPGDPLELDLRIALLKVCLRSGDLRAAASASESLWQHALGAEQPRHAAKAAWRGALLWSELEHRVGALRCIGRVLELRRDAPELEAHALLLRAQLLAPLEDALTTLDELTVCLRLSPNPELESRAHELHGDIHARKRDFQAASARYERVRDQSPLCFKLHDTLWLAGAPERAAQALPEGESLRSAMALAHYGHWEDALIMAEHVLETRRDEPHTPDRALAVAEFLRALRSPNPESRTILEVLTARQPPDDQHVFEVFLARADGRTPPPPRNPWRAGNHWSDWFAEMGRQLRPPERQDPDANVWRRARQRSLEHPGLWVERDSLEYLLAGERYSLGRKQLLKRLLRALLEHHEQHLGQAIGLDALFAAGWPDERGVLQEAALNRLRVSVRRLRANGLEGVILTREDEGYLLDPELPLHLFDLATLT